MTQVYTSTFELLQASLRSIRPELRGFYFSLDEPNDPEVKIILDRALGSIWVSAADAPIETVGNYQCVLRSNQILHVQAHRLEGGQLVLMSGMFSEPLRCITVDEKMPLPPVDERTIYHWRLEENGAVSFHEGAAAPDGQWFTVVRLAGPYRHCRMTRLEAPRLTPFDLPWKQWGDGLVNQFAAADNQIVWWRAVTAPPHYTQDDIR